MLLWPRLNSYCSLGSRPLEDKWKFILASLSLSIILQMEEVNGMSLKFSTKLALFPGFSIGTIMALFHSRSSRPSFHDRLKSASNLCFPWVQRCLTMWPFILSGPGVLLLSISPSATLNSCIVKLSPKIGFLEVEVRHLWIILRLLGEYLIFLSSLLKVRLLMLF